MEYNMKKLIYLIIFIISTNNLFAGKGNIVFVNKTSSNIYVKIETTTQKTFEQKVLPNSSWNLELSRTVGTPDIKDMWIKFSKGTTYKWNEINIPETELDYRKWKQNIDVKNNQTTNVEITYNNELNRFERKITRNGKVVEGNLVHTGKPLKTTLIVENETSYTIKFGYILGHNQWQEKQIKPKSFTTIRVEKTLNITEDLNHMIIEFEYPNSIKKNKLNPDQRWWVKTVNNKRKKQTIVKIKYENNKFEREVLRRGLIKERYGKEEGLKFSGDFRKLPAQPTEKMAKLWARITNLKNKRFELEVKKNSEKVGIKVAYNLLDAARASALGLNDIAKKIEETAKKTTQATLSLFNIEEASLTGSAKELSQGKLPALNVNYTILGSERSIDNFQFDMKHPEDAFKELGIAISQFIKEEINKIKGKKNESENA
jgi:hypothetical protein